MLYAALNTNVSHPCYLLIARLMFYYLRQEYINIDNCIILVRLYILVHNFIHIWLNYTINQVDGLLTVHVYVSV